MIDCFCSLGAVGLAVIDACKIAGATTIIAIDLNKRKKAVAMQFGATDFINPTTLPQGKTIQELIIEMTGGTGNDGFQRRISND